MSGNTYVFSPLARMSRLRADDTVVVWNGSGLDPQRVEIDGVGASALVAWILARVAPATDADMLSSLQQRLGMPGGDAARVLRELIDASVLVEPRIAEESRTRIELWSRYNWGDAAIFHAATFGQRFDPDTLDDLNYTDYYRRLLAEPGPVGIQPPATKSINGYGSAVCVPPADPHSMSVSAVLHRVAPINRFHQRGIAAADLQTLLQNALGAQRAIGGVLGDHLIKAFPSGGARHPLECYVIAKAVSGLSAGAYHFDPAQHALRSLPDTGAVEKIDQACFNKGGIVTASAVLVLTCRWLRHTWKYRYPRSYRMILLELGHLIQTVNLVSSAVGLAAYHCPSINDLDVLDLLDLHDDCAEGPLYAIGIGAEGVR